MKKTLGFICIVVIVCLMVSCSGEPQKMTAEGSVRYLITRDYGKQIIADKDVSYYEGQTIMDGIMETGVEIETAYEGGFIKSINGLESTAGGLTGERYDWFYYANGIFADTGALDYSPLPDDLIWWDYHAWKTAKGTSAVIGSFPEPFLHGYRGQVNDTIILAAAGKKEQAKDLQQLLVGLGVQKTKIEDLAEVFLEKRIGPTIVVGEWSELSKSSWLKRFNDDGQDNGTFVRFTDKGIAAMDINGETAQEFTGSAGVIMASGEGSGDASPLWIIAGTDQTGLAEALKIIHDEPEKITGTFSAIVFSGKVFRLPELR